ncbi:MAG: NAD-dependent epimerase/dehydratase family protein [Chlamydiales bacterium]
MKIFITGASGFLGRFLCKALTSYEITAPSSKECDLTHASSLSQFDDKRFDRIYHLAAWTQAGDFCLHHPGEQWIINQKINTNMLSWWQEKQPQAKLIAMGTSCSYPCAMPLKEENYLSGLPIESLFTYAMTKRMLLAGMQALHKQFGLSYLYLIPSTLYGPGYHTDNRQLHFIFDLIRKILAGKKEGSPVILWGDGEQKRELIHVKDFVQALLYLSESKANCHINVGAGREHSIKEFAALICQEVGYDPKCIKYDVTRHVGARSKVLSTALFQELYPGFSQTPLRQGLAQTVQWFANRHNQAQDVSMCTP